MTKTSAQAVPCPICGRPADPRLRPFCSERCSDIDLGRWLSDRYVIPTSDDDDGEPELPPNPDRR
ncbi:DNA gyrase inhibitor YacG [uncultured Methylobacterium sp.]|uniref:DNA gyrase inhibitor YacG n=1 Tax=uncultured Methylobacterium sp. TaxID=157278 RepID=UPI0035CC702A